MIEPVTDISPAALGAFDDIIDVRSPAEFAEDRLPGAINLPVLTNAERAEVGTIYLKQSRFLARRLGAAHVSRNIAHALDVSLADKPAKYRPLVYCWRGGMRSNAMATVLSQIGWRVGVLGGGYKTWRRAVVSSLHHENAPLKLLLIDGETGTAKSDILRRVAALGVQTLDLEAIAAHRGSVFGALADTPQPSQRGFESRLFDSLRRLDTDKPIVVEAESAQIGRCVIPARIWRAMRSASHLVIRAPVAARARYTVEAYRDAIAASGAVGAALDRLQPFHGKAQLEEWRAMLERGDHHGLAAGLMTEHYDPLYRRGRSLRAGPPVGELTLAGFDPECLDHAARAIGRLADSLAPAGP